MKELSIEEKSKRYDKLKVKAQELEEDGCFDKITLFDLFPELKESEDDVIRKAIIGYLKHLRGKHELFPDEWIAWLEKQGEQKPVFEMITPEESLGVDSDTYNKIVDECIYGEQKPAEDFDLPEFESYLCLMFQKFRTKGMCTNGEIIDYVKEHSQKLRDILVKPAWSEEDETALGDALWCCKQAASIAKDENDMGNVWYAENWLKSLKDRCLPQSKQGWSQNDINMIDWLIRCCEKEHEELCNDKYGHQDIVSELKKDCRKKWNWLESLKNKVVPQNTWKPSEEQMKALSIVTCGVDDPLFSLYQDLKKLKG